MYRIQLFNILTLKQLHVTRYNWQFFLQAGFINVLDTLPLRPILPQRLLNQVDKFTKTILNVNVLCYTSFLYCYGSRSKDMIIPGFFFLNLSNYFHAG